MIKTNQLVCAALAAIAPFAFLTLSSSASAEDGVSRDEIVFGTSSNFSAVTPGVAEEFNAGITAYMNKLNNSGGIFGRKLRRILVDDGYDPSKTLANTKRLIEQDRVFALVGFASTPGLAEILPLVREKNIPVIAPFSGGSFLRDSLEQQIFNIKSGQDDQIETLMKLGVYSMGLKSLCAFYQDDTLGQSAIRTTESVLRKSNLSLTAKTAYARNSLAVQDAASKLKAAGCKAVLIAAQDRQAKIFIQGAQEIDFHPTYFCLNLVATEEFISAVQPFNEDLFVALVTPLPTENVYPIVRTFHKELAKFNPRAHPTVVTLEGYLAGAVIEHVLKKAGKSLTRGSFRTAFENLRDADIGGLKFTFNRANRQATSRVLLGKISGGELSLFN